MEELEFYKVTWVTYTGSRHIFKWTAFDDDKVLKRLVFINEETNEVLTLNYTAFDWMTTKPVDKINYN